MRTQFVIMLALIVCSAGCARRETDAPPHPPPGKLPAEVAGDPESALPRAKRK